jgi:hypothetical protein
VAKFCKSYEVLERYKVIPDELTRLKAIFDFYDPYTQTQPLAFWMNRYEVLNNEPSTTVVAPIPNEGPETTNTLLHNDELLPDGPGVDGDSGTGEVSPINEEIADTDTDTEEPTDTPASFNPRIVGDNEPDEIKQLREKAKGFHKLQSYHHAKLRNATTDEERYEQSQIIMEEIIPEIDAIYNVIREWKKTDVVLVVPQTREFDRAVKMMKKRESLRTRLIKLKSHLRKKVLDNQKRFQYEQELEAKTKELAELNRQLNL